MKMAMNWVVIRHFQPNLCGLAKHTRPGKLLHSELERSTISFMGKLTISMGHFNSYFDITRGYPTRSIKIRQESEAGELVRCHVDGRMGGIFVGEHV